MEKMKRFIDVWVPVTTCTLRCHYCYITHHRLFDSKLPKFKYSPETFRKGLSKERLGGVCMFNLCGGGETLLPPEMPKYIRALLEEGHYVMVVTNATVDKAFNEMSEWPKDLLDHLFFKFSYHFIELKKRNLFEKFFSNIRKMKDAGASFTLEATPSDELIPYIEEMKALAVQEVGAVCHITVGRDEHNMSTIPILSQMTPVEYYNTWKVFDSEFFEYKFSVFSQKRTEFCYAGDWTLFLDMGSGILHQCYCSLFNQNIFEDVSKPIKFKAIGHFCQQPHCYNAHAFLTFGAIPEHESPTYATIRNRICVDGSEWLKPKMKVFMECRLKNANNEYSDSKKVLMDTEMWFLEKWTKLRGKLEQSKCTRKMYQSLRKTLR